MRVRMQIEERKAQINMLNFCSGSPLVSTDYGIVYSAGQRLCTDFLATEMQRIERAILMSGATRAWPALNRSGTLFVLRLGRLSW